MMNPGLTVCTLWHLCASRYPFEFQKTKRAVCYLAGLNVISADMKCAMVVSSGLLVLVILQDGQLFVPNQRSKLQLDGVVIFALSSS